MYHGSYLITLGQINPIAETSDNQLVAADAKLNFDDNAAYRQKEIFALRDPTQGGSSWGLNMKILYFETCESATLSFG